MPLRFKATAVGMLAIFGLIFCFSAVHAQTVVPADSIERHPLEVEALIQPRSVLDKLQPLISSAIKRTDYHELSLLYLAKSNACRVIADWNCQIQAATQASRTAMLANKPLLQIRGLISQGRGQIAMQAFSASETSMGEAERLLSLNPSKPLLADVMLAYSSLSFSLNKAELSAEYADRGLAALGSLPAPAIRVRLLRNKARAFSQLNKDREALALLDEALRLGDALDDPKLDAELYLEEARIAGEYGDTQTQTVSGNKIIQMAERLKNAQLLGLGHEVLGQAALGSGNWQLGEAELDKAQTYFRSLGLSRDERRALRVHLKSLLERNSGIAELKARSARLIELEKALEIDDRNLVSESLNSQLEYAQQKFDMQKLQTDAELSKQREAVAKATQRATYIAAFLSICLLIVFAAFSIFQRRTGVKLQKVNTQLLASEARLRAITDNIPAFIAHIDSESRYLFVNAHIVNKYNLSAKSIVGMSVLELRGKEKADFVEPYIHSVLAGEQQHFELEEATTDGRMYYQSSYVPDVGADGIIKGFYSLSFDITALKKAQMQLNQLSRTDSLTGVANRRHFEEDATAALARGRRDNHTCALLCLDIDHFKSINDRYGHPAGDAVIVELCKRMQSCIREVDLLARLGGDEFVILMENTAPGSAEAVCEKIIAVMQQPFAINENRLQVTVSVGIAYSRPSSSSEDLFRQADQALYTSKKSGRNQYSATSA